MDPLEARACHRFCDNAFLSMIAPPLSEALGAPGLDYHSVPVSSDLDAEDGGNLEP